jgi:hypothetical protein
MRNIYHIRFGLFFLVFISCVSYRNISSVYSKKNIIEEPNCDDDINPILEIWNHTGNEFIIGKHKLIKDEYIKADGWDNNDFPFPKKIDVKVTLVSNERLYDNENYKIPKCTLNIELAYKVAFNNNSTYPLNSYIIDRKMIVTSKILENIKFKDINGKSNFYEFIISGVEFEEVYKKVIKKGQSLNQLIFNIQIKNDLNNCNYQYTYPVNKI